MYHSRASWTVKDVLGGTVKRSPKVKRSLANESKHKPTNFSSSCSSPYADEISLREQGALYIANKGLKRRIAESSSADESESGTEATTKHPRHRPGCGCIVCTQPPSKNARQISRRKKKSTESGRKAEFSEGYVAEAPSMMMNSIEDDMLAEALAGIDMDSLIHAASMPLDMFLRENKNPSWTQ